ncbi:TIM barrel protein [Rhizobium sp. KVB221]|uniref:TIM barrel protein n=1 Tax=Rhizobium setariae TaxID=2801340 RepID=A0A937CNL3_9HYPH|nr:TIM barrel protein [Rhizobium setariae]MBL0373881.1 TIM barrel protein [Rhizobium setariae]
MLDGNKTLVALDRLQLTRLIARIDAIPLFAHSYSHHLNMRFGDTSPADMLSFAHSHGLSGLCIHVDDGEGRSLSAMSPQERSKFGSDAIELNLTIHVETSSTSRADLADAIAVANDIGARSIRCYPRYEGSVSSVMTRTIEDFGHLDQLDPQQRLRFTLEQHEDLKSYELAAIARQSGNPRLSLLFDFGNMINAYETPDAALEAMAPLVTEVHIKDVKAGEDRGGWSQIACRSGEGMIDFPEMLCKLLLLGSDQAQIGAFALQEENGMLSPAFRFPDEGADPFIPWRAPSTTEPPADEPLMVRLEQERQDAARQVDYVRGVLADLREAAVIRLAC